MGMVMVMSSLPDGQIPFYTPGGDRIVEFSQVLQPMIRKTSQVVAL